MFVVVLASIVAVMVSQAGLSNARSAALHSVTEDELRELGDDVLEEMERFLREINSTEENSTMTTPTTTQTPDTAASPTEDSCEEDAPVTESTGQADDGDCSCETEFSDEQEVTIREREEYSVAFYVDTSEPVSNCTKRCKVMCDYESLGDGRVKMTCKASNGGRILSVKYTATGKPPVDENIVNGEFTIPHKNIQFGITEIVFEFRVLCDGVVVTRRKRYLVAKGLKKR